VTTAPPSIASPLARARNFLGRHTRGLTIANIFAQGGIIVTGGAVRLTGSGLGCSTWPQCEPGHFTPEAFDASNIHPYVEFAMWNSRRELRWWGLVPLLGVVGQAVLGGIVVLAKLNPVLVSPHLLLSMGLVWQAVWLALRFRDAPRRDSNVCIKKMLRTSTVLLCGLLVLGTLTTGAGPHSGDAAATERLGLDPTKIAQAHAGVVWLFIAVLAYLVWRVRNDRSEGSGIDGKADEVRKAWMVLVGVTLAQGAIGYIQFFTGLPEVIVGMHLAGAATLTAAHSAAYYLLKRDRRKVMAR